MTRDEYLGQLSKYLKKLPKADYDDAMEYFTEYFSETDDDEAKKLMEELGTPKEAACDIISNVLDKRIDEKKQADEKKQDDSGKRSVLGILWVAILAICAIPVATPLLISGLVVMFCILLCIVLVLLCVFLVGVCSVHSRTCRYSEGGSYDKTFNISGVDAIRAWTCSDRRWNYCFGNRSFI